jgi:hypothetical protein
MKFIFNLSSVRICISLEEINCRIVKIKYDYKF